MSQLVGAIEAGGTKFVCAIGTGPEDLRQTCRIDTTTPAQTLAAVVDFFRSHHDTSPLAALGIGSFGPVDLDRSSQTYGHITSTPKPGWAQTDIVGQLQREFDVPVGFDTDVNAAALGEHRWGAARDVDTFVYLTVGTGIGGGAMAGGVMLHGLLHPEMGHIRLPRDMDLDADFEGICPFHGDCLEGLASGPAIEARWGQPAHQLAPDHAAWELEAHYLALGLWNFTCSLSPQRFILGGGVMDQPHLLPRVRRHLQRVANRYLQAPQLEAEIDAFIVPPGLGSRAGISGALALAQQAMTM